MKKNKNNPAIQPKHYPYREARIDGTQCDTENLRRIEAHVSKHISPVTWVWAEINSSLIHLDVLIVNPTDEFPFYTLVTSGMSQRPMKPPTPEVAKCKYAELVLCLPSDWPLFEPEIRKSHNFWPIQMMKLIARFPHLQNTWLWHTHTIQNQRPYDSSTPFAGALLLQSRMFGEEFLIMETKRDQATVFHNLIPLHQAELDYYLEHGTGPLLDALADQNLGFVLDPLRPCAV